MVSVNLKLWTLSSLTRAVSYETHVTLVKRDRFGERSCSRGVHVYSHIIQRMEVGWFGVMRDKFFGSLSILFENREKLSSVGDMEDINFMTRSLKLVQRLFQKRANRGASENNIVTTGLPQ